MADVLLIRRWLLFGCVVKVADLTMQTHELRIAVLWAVAGVALVLHERVGAGAVALVGFGTAVAQVGHASNHVAAIAWVALVLAVLDGEDRRTAWWSLAIVIYGFAAVNKALFGFLSGDIIRLDGGISVPAAAARPLAFAAVAIEGWLACAVWRRSRWALPASILLHAGIVVWSGFPSLIDLGIEVLFNGMLVLLVWVTTRERTPHVAQGHASSSARPVAPHALLKTPHAA